MADPFVDYMEIPCAEYDELFDLMKHYEETIESMVYDLQNSDDILGYYQAIAREGEDALTRGLQL